MTRTRTDVLRLLAPAFAALLAPGCVVVSDDAADDGGSDSSGGSDTGVGSADSTGGVPGDCVELGPDDVATDTTLPAGCYSVSTLLALDHRLDLEPGVEMYFASFAGLMVGPDGVLSAIGTPDMPVLMTSATGEGWNGVQLVGSASSDNLLEHVVLDSVAATGISVGGTSRLSVMGCEIAGAPEYGMTAAAGAEILVGGSTFASNAIPLSVDVSAVAGIGMDNVFVDNDEQIVEVNAGTLAQDAQWPWPGVPFRATGNLSIQSALVFDPGLTLEMPQDAQIDVTTGGTLTASGTADAPVTIRGVLDERGYWRGLSVESKAAANTLSNCIIENGGSEPWNGSPDSVGMVWLEDESKLQISDCTLRGSGGPAVGTFGGADLSGFANNVIEDNASTVMVMADMAHQIEPTNTFSANDESFVRVGRETANNHTIQDAATWSTLDVPYRVIERFFVEGAWTVEAGATIEVAQDTKIVVEDTGSLTAVGTADSPIVFRGVEGLTGFWQGLHLQSASASNQLQFVEVRNAGSDPFNGDPDSDGAIYLDQATLNLSDATIADSGGHGIVVWDDGQLLGCTNVVFSGNVKADTYVRATGSSACG